MLSQQAAGVRASPMPKSQKVPGALQRDRCARSCAAPGASGPHADRIPRLTKTDA